MVRIAVEADPDGLQGILGSLAASKLAITKSSWPTSAKRPPLVLSTDNRYIYQHQLDHLLRDTSRIWTVGVVTVLPLCDVDGRHVISKAQ